MTREERTQAFNEWWTKEMSRELYSPAFNKSLETIFNNTTLPLHLRVWAWLIRHAWGNWSRCPCRWSEKEGRRGESLNQSDCTRDLKVVSKSGKLRVDRVNRIMLQFAAAGLVEIKGQLLLLSEKPAVAAISALTQSERKWTKYNDTAWPVRHPEEAKKLAELEEQARPLKMMRFGDYHKWLEESDTQYSTDAGADFSAAVPRESAACFEDGGETAAKAFGNGHKSVLKTGPKVFASLNKGTRARINSEQFPSVSTVSEASSSPPEVLFGGDDDSLRSPEQQPNPISVAMATYGTVPDAAVGKMVAECRRNAPDIADDEIVELIHRKARESTNATNRPGLLLKKLPDLCVGYAFQHFRAQQREQRAQEDSARNRAEEDRLALLERVRDDPNSSEAERALAQDVLAHVKRA